MSSTTPFDLSHATCYYRTRASRISDELVYFLVIVVGITTSMTDSAGSSGTIMWMSPMLLGEVVSILGLALLAASLPTLFYTGPTLAISKEGLYYEFNGGTLALIPWDNIDYFLAATTSRWPKPMIRMYIKNKSALFDHIERQLGKLPFLVRIQLTFKRILFPFDIYATTFTTGTRDSILEELKSELAHHREHNSEKDE